MFFGSILIIRVSTVAIIFLFLLSPLPLLAVGVLLRHSATMAEHIRYDTERSCAFYNTSFHQYILLYSKLGFHLSYMLLCYYKPSATALKIRFERGRLLPYSEYCKNVYTSMELSI